MWFGGVPKWIAGLGTHGVHLVLVMQLGTDLVDILGPHVAADEIADIDRPGYLGNITLPSHSAVVFGVRICRLSIVYQRYATHLKNMPIEHYRF